MPKKEKKIQQVEQLAEGLKESQAVVFADYSGLSVAEMTNLRKKLSQLAAKGEPRQGRGAELRVVKNTLIKLAAEKAKLSLDNLIGPTAVLLSKKADPIESIKTVVLAFREKGAVKFGIFEGALLDAPKVLELARLPARKVLESRLVGALNSPVAKLILTLKGTQQSLVTVLTEVSKTRGGGTA